MPPDGMTSDIVRSSTYCQWLDSSGVSDARSLIIRRAKLSALWNSSVHGHPRGYNVLNLNRLASVTEKTANPSDNETSNPEMDEFIDQDIVVNMVKSLTKIKKAGP